MENLKDTIRKISTNHLSMGYAILGQCLSAVGWVNNTVPPLENHPGLIELPMADVMGGGIATGLALVGQRPIYIIRYQGFNWFNASIIANYAGKTMDIWNIPAPIFIRSLAMEGGIGPVAGSSHHGIYARMPGVDIVSPMCPNEYVSVYNHFMANDRPMYVSEHRKSFNIDKDFVNKTQYDQPDITLFPISITRLEMEEVYNQCESLGIKINIFHQLWIKPFTPSTHSLYSLTQSKFGGLLLDDDYANGVAKQLAFDLIKNTGKPMDVLTIGERTAGFSKQTDNLPPNATNIVEFIKRIIKYGD